MSPAQVHQLHDDPPSPMPASDPLGVLADAVTEHVAEERSRYAVVGERLQGLHAKLDEHEKASARRHEALLRGLQTQADATLAVTAEVSAMGRHVERLAAKADVVALGAQVGRQALDSIADGERQDAEIAKTKRLAVVRVGALLGAGAALYKLFEFLYPYLHRS